MTTLIERLSCWLGWHAYVRSYTWNPDCTKVERVQLVCMDCRKESPGWTLSDEQDARDDYERREVSR